MGRGRRSPLPRPRRTPRRTRGCCTPGMVGTWATLATTTLPTPMLPTTIRSPTSTAAAGTTRACPDVAQQYGRDAYLPSSKAKNIYIGQEVHFNIDLNAEGMPVVSEMHPVRIEAMMQADG